MVFKAGFLHSSMANEANMERYVIPVLSNYSVITLQGGKMDISQLVRDIKEAKKTNYDLFSQLEESKRHAFTNIKELCDSTADSNTCQTNAKRELTEIINQIGKEQSGRILFPYNYMSIRNSKWEYQDTPWNQDCEFCDHFQLSMAIRYTVPEKYPVVYDRFKTKDKYCQKHILEEFVNKLKTERFPRACLQIENKNHDVCKIILQDMGIINNRTLSLAKQVYGENALKTTEA